MQRFFPIAIAAALLAGGSAQAACQLERLVELPVTMAGLRPTIPVQINGTDAVLAIDSGSFFGILSPAAALQLHLPLGPAPDHLQIAGLGGFMSYSVARVAHLRLGDVDLKDMDFVVGGNQVGANAQGLLGANVLNNADVEYDLADGVVRLMRPKGCGRDTLAYWSAGKPYSMIGLASAGPLSAPRATAFLNGKRIQVLFDTGSPMSLLSLRAARRAGFSTTGPDVVPGGYSYGVGQGTVPTWIARFESFKLGDEEVRNTRLRVADLGNAPFDMLIGTDFFLAHHLYVANSQQRLYFTYNGGPVFNLAPYLPRSPSMPPAASPSASSAGAGATTTPSASAGAPGADELARQGAALAARGQYPQAIDALSQAIALAPAEPDYYQQRGLIEARAGHPVPALADLDQALRGAPHDVTARMARARLRLQQHDPGGAWLDALTLDRDLPREADLRLQLAQMDMRLQQYPAAVHEYGEWLDAHRSDIAVAMALSDRCWARALADQELRPALADCNAALRAHPTPAARAMALDRRGLVQLRLGDYGGSARDYDAALRIDPRRAGALYGRGIDETREGHAAMGAADLAAATALQSDIAVQFSRAGIHP